jgi:hypothetical protein
VLLITPSSGKEKQHESHDHRYRQHGTGIGSRVLAGGRDLTVPGKDSKGAEAAAADIGGDGTVKTAVPREARACAKTRAVARDSTGATGVPRRDTDPPTIRQQRSL